jgi:hypothetical protein
MQFMNAMDRCRVPIVDCVYVYYLFLYSLKQFLYFVGFASLNEIDFNAVINDLSIFQLALAKNYRRDIFCGDAERRWWCVFLFRRVTQKQDRLSFHLTYCRYRPLLYVCCLLSFQSVCD